MGNFESMFRWAIYYDFKTTPEKIADEVHTTVFGCSHNQFNNSHFRMSLKTMLESFKDTIIASAKENNIDARAIVGAISWEYEVNWKGRFSDYYQYQTLRFSPNNDSGIGWGSIHSNPARKLYPKVSNSELNCLRLDASSAIKMVARIMGDNAKLYYDLCYVWINDNPEAIAFFFNTGEKKVKESAIRQSTFIGPRRPIIPLHVLVNPMAMWVKSKIDTWAGFKTYPTHPKDEFYIRVYSI